MTFYGVEETLHYGQERFQVAFDSGNSCSLEQRDVFVIAPYDAEHMDLGQYRGRDLLAAYRGENAEARRAAYAEQAATLQHTNEEHRRADGLPNWRMQRQEKRQISALERALSDELRTLGRDMFDLQRLQAISSRYDKASERFLRSFYFDEVNERHIHNFCRKYATDPEYRATVDEGAAPWYTRNALFERNLWRECAGSRGAEGWEQCAEAFFHWIDQHHQAITALPEYQRIKAHDDTWIPSAWERDPGIREAVVAWNAIPGIRTCFSCQGVSGLVTHLGRTLLVASYHEEHGYIAFDPMEETLASRILKALPGFAAVRVPQVSVTRWPPVETPFGIWRHMLVSASANDAFCREALALAREVAARE